MREVVPTARRAALSFLALAWCAACGSTETGNPPVISKMLFHWSPGASTVVVTGEPGAVKPGGTTLEFKNLETGEVTRIVTRRDGSFRVELEGSLDDGFSATARNEDGRSEAVMSPGRQASGASTSDAGPDAAPDASDAAAVEAADAGTDAGMDAAIAERDAAPAQPAAQSCAEMNEVASAALDRAISGADRACEAATDCVFLRETARASCLPGCSDRIASRDGQASVLVAVAEIEAAVCAPSIVAGCRPEPVDCNPELRVLACRAGQCTTEGAPAPEPEPSSSCEDLYREAEARIAAALASADACSTADDCTLAYITTDCHAACAGVPVAFGSFGQVADVILDTDEQLCGPFEANGCTRVVDTCTTEDQPPVCVDGRCMRAP